MASSSTSFIKARYQYDVFLSFSGEDTRKNFIDHLYDALHRHGIHTFKDNERLKKGKSIGDQLWKSIEESKMFIIVFSKKYASSSWCLNELIKIMECQKSNEQIAYPVFYDVDPSEIRKQHGPVGEALAKHTNKETGKWREALTEAANLSGWDLKNTSAGHEARVIKLIVEQILLDLRSFDVNLDDHLVGMEPRLQDLQMSLKISLKEVRMIGIKGMGGAGKTTLARATFNKISTHFEAKTFVENVREVSNASLSGLLSLQRKVLSDLLNGQGNNISSVHEGTNMMKTRLRGRKVLVVLDDVDHKDQLEALAGDLNWFMPGSRIIITTRDEQVLIAHKVKWIHDVNLLSGEEAIGLFSRHAFGKDSPVQAYEMQSLEVVRYAAGLPLTIIVLGSFLCGKDMPEWNDALKRLKTIPLKETLEKLELSYKSLEDDYKEIFLDVACLFKGWEKNQAIGILESCGFHARNGLKVLKQRSFITFDEFDDCVYLGMHDHIEEMGKNIVRRLHPKEPNKHSRVWIQEEIEDVLGNDLCNEATRCMKLELTHEIMCKGFGNMKKLRCLIINSRYNNHLPKSVEVSQYFPNSLQYLRWNGYPHWCLPKTFLANNLGTLIMQDSSIEQLWVHGKVMKKLKSIDLSGSKLRILELGLTPNLVRLELLNCYNLEELHVPVGGLKSLLHLDLCCCKKLKSFSFIKELESLEVLLLNGLHLKEFPDIIPSHSNSNLQHLNFSDNDIEYLPSSIGNLHNLVCLYLNRCTKLKSLPERICNLEHLRELWLYGSAIEELPEGIGQLGCLEKLDLTYSKVKHLPNSICMLKHLKSLLLEGCNNVSQLPNGFGQMESLDKLYLRLSKIRDLPSSICMLKHLRELVLRNCYEFEKLPKNLGDLKCLEKLHLCYCKKIREIPSSICMLKHLRELDLRGCYEFEKLPKNLGDLKCLEMLHLSYCEKIREIPSSICKLKHLKGLYLSWCSELKRLPENLGGLECLENLHLCSCKKIREIPSSICKLKHLKDLDLSWCSELKKLPGNLGDLECLEKLSSSNSKIRHIPSSICNLKHLKELDLSCCSELKKLPENLGDLKCLEKLSSSNSKIRHIPSSICNLKHLKELDFSWCSELKKLPENLGDLKCLGKLNLKSTPVSHLPHNISLLKDLRILGYEKRIDPDALLSQEQHITRAPKRKSTNIEAAAGNDESQPLDLNEQMVDYLVSMTSHTEARRSNRLRKTPQEWNDFVLGSTSAGDKVKE